jgi:DNA-binding beta-propeller fold protein YncE
VKTTKAGGDRPNGIALAGGDLWVTSAGSAWLTRVSATTGRERAKHVKVGLDARAIVAYRDSIWVAVTSTREVLRIDARSGDVRARLRVAAKPIRLAVSGSGVWVGTDWEQGGAGQLLRYDGRTGALRQTIVVNEGVGGLVAAAGAIWVIKSRSNKVSRLEPGAGELVDWATLPAPAQTMRYGAGSLWVTYEGDAIARVAVRGGSMVTASAGHGPAQAVVAGGRVFVASRNDQAVLMLDPDELAPVGEPIRVGLNPYAMIADDRFVWVTGLGDNTLSRIAYR